MLLFIFRAVFMFPVWRLNINSSFLAVFECILCVLKDFIWRLYIKTYNNYMHMYIYALNYPRDIFLHMCPWLFIRYFINKVPACLQKHNLQQWTWKQVRFLYLYGMYSWLIFFFRFIRMNYPPFIYYFQYLVSSSPVFNMTTYFITRVYIHTHTM